MVFNEKLERLQNGLEETKQELKDFRAQQHQNREQFETELVEIKEYIEQKEHQIDTLQTENQEKIDKIFNLENALD